MLSEILTIDHSYICVMKIEKCIYLFILTNQNSGQI